MKAREAPDFWGLHKNMNSAFPLICNLIFFDENVFDKMKVFPCKRVMGFRQWGIYRFEMDRHF